MDGFPVVVEEKVRFGDLDAYRHLNNAAFFRFFEQARIAYYRRLGLDVLDPAITRKFVVAETGCRFLAEGNLDDRLECGARAVRLGTSSLEFEHRLERAGQPLAEGRTVVVFLDFEARRPAPIPEALREAIRALEGRSIDPGTPPVP